MTSSLADVVNALHDDIGVLQPSLNRVPTPVEYAVLHDGANARLPSKKDPLYAAMKVAKSNAQATIDRVRKTAQELKKGQNPIWAETAKQDLKAWDEATGKVQWKKVVALGGTAAVAGGVGAVIGSHRGYNHSETDAKSDSNPEEASVNAAVLTDGPVKDASTSFEPSKRSLTIEDLD
ncbi:hypothetical protein FRB98_006382 [Tulasnella sp. 332]|nr:hypothetical protein FRB98_006382 [Tulasnella sp. 332]